MNGNAKYGAPAEIEKTPLVAERGQCEKAGEKLNHICVSEPWPFGVFMSSQVPLATYFQ